ncbi:Trypanosomal VSG domain containing protein, putative [Trypanosoma equiperdum]|uniref:Trypanosomal VSG domain containing protein, putative n=1 Tax=Trypanosoma equiperdum TaxID=5694 RepID=A0A1G4IF36_TRYEQ|nr:Trypanosomal VSG domain containing protein, putative [Trypanosoma equiperdum]
MRTIEIAGALVCSAILWMPQEVMSATTVATNQDAFSVLCGVYSALKAKTVKTNVLSQLQKLAYDIGAINISAAPAIFSEKFNPVEGKTKDNHPDKPAEGSPGLADWTKYGEFWLESKKALIEMRKDGNGADLRQAAATTKGKLKHFAQRAFNALSDPTLGEPATKQQEYDAAVQKAIYGAGGQAADPKAPTDAADRTTECGPASGAKGSLAGEAIRTDMLCLCATGGATSGTNIDKVCCPECTNPGRSGGWKDGATGKASFEKFITECPPSDPESKASGAAIRTSIAGFLASVSKPKGTGDVRHFTLGNPEGDGSTGCTGSSGATAGFCVQYKAAAGGGQEKLSVAWLAEAYKAAKLADELDEANQKAQKLLDRIAALNDTAHAAAYAPPATSADHAEGVKPVLPKIDAKECNAMKTNTTCKTPCTWHESESDPNKPCKSRAACNTIRNSRRRNCRGSKNRSKLL